MANNLTTAPISSFFLLFWLHWQMEFETYCGWACSSASTAMAALLDYQGIFGFVHIIVSNCPWHWLVHTLAPERATDRLKYQLPEGKRAQNSSVVLDLLTSSPVCSGIITGPEMKKKTSLSFSFSAGDHWGWPQLQICLQRGWTFK